MKLGLIARADDTGLGSQTWEFARHMRPDKTLVVDLSHLKHNTLHPERFPDATIAHGFPNAATIQRFLDGLDVVFTAETPYGPWLYTLAARMNVKTALQYNYEFLDDRASEVPTLLLAPTSWHYDDVHHPNKQLLPVPIATDRFSPRVHATTAAHFLHIVGKPAIHDRNGTADLLDALPMVRSHIAITITCQDPSYVPRLLRGRTLPDNITLIVDHAAPANYWELYRAADAMIMPRRFGGLCLPMNEALGAGIPVIMPDISPNTDLLPTSWLVPATKTGEFKARRIVDLHTIDHRELADLIDRFATDQAFYTTAAEDALDIAELMSWGSLKSEYDHLLANQLAATAA